MEEITMKKLISLVCIVALLCSVAFSALASASPAETNPQGTLTNAEDEWNETVVELFSSLGQSDANLVEVFEKIADIKDENGNLVNENITVEGTTLKVTKEDNTTLEIDLEKVDFASGFSVAPEAGEEVLQYNSLKGVSPKDFVILLINPVTGQIAVIELNEENVDENGVVTVNFPFPGIYTLVNIA